MIQKREIEDLILATMPDAETEIEDLTGENKNFFISVTSSQFIGKSPVQQHQLVYKALGDKIRDKIHAVKIQTLTK